jgi:hypothetical protein
MRKNSRSSIGGRRSIKGSRGTMTRRSIEEGNRRRKIIEGNKRRSIEGQ